MSDIIYSIPWRCTTQFRDLGIDGSGGSDSRNINSYLEYTFGNNNVKDVKKRWKIRR
ncbi:hypothetical protein LX97_00554 [Nonlabens dokdonensis]|jgi:hypothetical protein|uniref:Uncharacterized protein n=2 Tax=Nonlabens dokdonensis TaxID=328515 RepID=L7W310_NONDD|nr:hypothetical protein [Nonlabens dokdonensis]AGC75870.1 hypothetical protein DDD_0743 [Nonlabens dokdonensis DSW-6]PZX43553.1 hypothetical protein LX97_00554 [Nonlabens dokdonensis]